MKRSINKLTKGENLLWESSRMMLPEHKEQFIAYRQGLHKKIRPQLDEQQSERIFRTLTESMHFGTEITIVMFGEWDDKPLKGIVAKLDPQLQKIKFVQNNDDAVWIRLDDIVDTLL